MRSSLYWMIERYHPSLGWICTFDSYACKLFRIEMNGMHDTYALMRDFIDGEIYSDTFSSQDLGSNLDHSCWVKGAQKRYNTMNKGLSRDFYTSLALGTHAPRPILQWDDGETPVCEFIEQTNALSRHLNLCAILRDGEGWQNSSAHDIMRDTKILQDLGPLGPDNLRIILANH